MRLTRKSEPAISMVSPAALSRSIRVMAISSLASSGARALQASFWTGFNLWTSVNDEDSSKQPPRSTTPMTRSQYASWESTKNHHNRRQLRSRVRVYCFLGLDQQTSDTQVWPRPGGYCRCIKIWGL